MAAFKNPLEKLRAFKGTDIYDAFKEMLPDIDKTPEDQKKVITELLLICCNELLKEFRDAKKPLKRNLKPPVVKCMDAIKIADTDAANKDFGYELCWYLSDIAGLRLKLSSESHAWGYWKISGDEVKTTIK